MSEIHPKIAEVLSETFKVPVVEIIPEATMDSLEMDSLAVAELAVIIKETLGIDADAESFLKGATLTEITAFLDEAKFLSDANEAYEAEAYTPGTRQGETFGPAASGDRTSGVDTRTAAVSGADARGGARHTEARHTEARDTEARDAGSRASGSLGAGTWGAGAHRAEAMSVGR